MVSVSVIIAATALLQAVSSAVPPGFKSVLANNVIVPKTTKDLAKNNVTAKWAPGYPKEWGSEDYHHLFDIPDPDDTFNGVITGDGKVLALFNNTHAELFDLVNNITASVFQLQVPDKNFIVGVNVNPSTQGGYDVFYGVATYMYDYAKTTFRQRVGSDLKPLGTPIAYEGQIGTISKQGKMVTLGGQIYDLSTTDNTPAATLEGQHDITDFSFSPDGVHLASVSYREETADLWNATSGEKIFAFPPTRAQNWLTRFSPDGKYIAITLGSTNNTIQFYQLSNLTAPPFEIKGFNFPSRVLDWSPTSQQIAIGDDGRFRIFNVPSKEIVQTWEVESNDYGNWGLRSIAWLDNGNQIAWQWGYGKYMYDFKTNTEWLWTIRAVDHSWGPEGLYLLKDKGQVVTVDGDSTVRFWKI
ncbi:YVTN repeat-like/Quino protein amine dehydrogenase [Bimuria novae-zelandiae CBS 107.79]|uniref:YVTN repeat-like/Quino protein amine dehydrogenase n=1 Tax=Bimuria novae-zelandiae CBS 107.79 TaxID=1447943 RepID=A0A6A5V1U7_9PLEO|nr:YVTN repeat-like/Quino protein amine dehydrogenase [Bimuria novae-zelandiae CBS 107.79]